MSVVARQSKVIPMPRPKWSQRDYQVAKKEYLRTELMKEVVQSILASHMGYTAIAERAGVSANTVHRWAAGHTTNGRLDKIVQVLHAVGKDLTIIDKRR